MNSERALLVLRVDRFGESSVAADVVSLRDEDPRNVDVHARFRILHQPEKANLALVRQPRPAEFEPASVECAVHQKVSWKPFAQPPLFSMRET